MHTPYYRRRRRKQKPLFRSTQHHGHGHKKNKVLKGSLIVAGVLIIMCGTVLAGYQILKNSGQKSLKNQAVSTTPELASTDENEGYGDPDLVWHNGKAYRYNEDITSILCMGIDQQSDEILKVEGISGESGQADSIFLFVMNPDDKKMKIIGISRDTMTEIPTFDYKGNPLGESVNHLGLAYSFGDGKEKSCEYMMEAVSKLFYKLPINGYAAVNLKAVEKLNNAVGGVNVTIAEDLSDRDPELKQGAKVTLDGKQALTFIQSRNMDEDNSNLQRMARQKQYAYAFVGQAKQAIKENMSLPVKLYNELSAQMVTNIKLNDIVYLASQAINMSLNSEDILMLEGEAKKGAVYDEYYVDDDALYELILDTFYTEEKAGEAS